MKFIALLILFLYIGSWLFAGEPYDVYRMDRKLVNALILSISKVIIVLEAVLKTDIDPDLREAINKSIEEFQGILKALEE